MPWRPFPPLCIWRWNIHPKTKSKSLLGVNPCLSSAWCPPFCINLGLSPRPLWRGAYSNQRPQSYLQWTGRRGEVWGFGKYCCEGWPWEVFSGWSSATSSGEGRVDRISQENVDVFAWSAYEAPRVDSSFIYYHLNVNPSVTPQKVTSSALIQGSFWCYQGWGDEA